jgi:Cdc6-like AAA superfamily ATPase
LWINGIPGSGKTVLASFIIEQVKHFCENNTEFAHAYYYCHYTHNQDEASPFLRWAIGKLSRQSRWISQQIKELHDQGCDPSIPELQNALEAVTSKFKGVYLVIDAVDESSPRDDLIAVITTIAVDKRFQNIQVLATSRLYFDIEKTFSGISISISMANPLVEKDIREFVRSRLRSSDLMKRWQYLLEEIEDYLVDGAKGM